MGMEHETGYLLVIENGSSSVVELPETGAIAVGNARVLVDRGELRVDGSARVNGELISGARALTTGDVIAIGDAVLVVQAPARVHAPSEPIDEVSWRRRLAEEVERALAYRRPLAVVAFTGGANVGALRNIDVLARGDDGVLLALLPEAEPDVAVQLARRACEGRAGIACMPFDAIDADGLAFMARAAARVAPEGDVAIAAEAVERRTFGERTVLLCHPAMIRVYDLIARLASASLPVLIVGETGVGKENAAFAVHYNSDRRDKPFVALNCAALPEQLVESQLFGHDKGAFTGAVASRVGLLESVEGGTLFLDEIGELALPIQAKLLRAIETQRITRVGENRERPIDCRFVAATHRKLDREVAAGRFREDLYFRLSAAKVIMPPLRDRRCDIAMLFRSLIDAACQRAGRSSPVATPEVMRALLAHAWPGNVRELRNLAELLAATCVDDSIELVDLPLELIGPPPDLAPPPAPPSDATIPMRRLSDEMSELERRRMAEALALANGVKTRAAALLGMPIRTFTMKLKLHDL